MTGIEKGTVKVVWIGKDAGKIYSKMFNDTESALSYAKGRKDFLVFRLIRHKDMNEFAWTLLPHGGYKLYTVALRAYKKNGKIIGALFR